VDAQTASIVVVAAAAVGAAVWLVSVLRALRLVSGDENERTVHAEAVVSGDAEDVARRLARALTSGGSMGLSPLRVEVADSRRVEFRMPSDAAIMPLTAGLRGEFALERRSGEQTAVTLRSNNGAMRRAARVTLYLCFLLGLPLLLFLPATLLFWVAPHPMEAIRWQVVQVMHVGHVLWPPFLVLWMGRRNQSIIVAGLGQALDRVRFDG
jgi:hypothetical protein